MVVFSNQRLGPGAELLVSDHVASHILRATAAAASPFAEARWELELVRWLESRAAASETIGTEAVRSPVLANDLDVGDIAWTPGNFEPQRRFLLEAIGRAAESSTEHAVAFDRWRRLIEAHPADSVQRPTRWNWQPTASIY